MSASNASDVSIQHGNLSIILVAAGRSSRMEGVDKLFLSIDGRPVFWHSLAVFDACGLVNTVIVVTHPSRTHEFRESIEQSGFSKPYQIVAGGDRRQDSVRNGIEELGRIKDDATFVAVHDAARPFVDVDMLARGVFAAKRIGAAIPVVPLKDTIKRVANGLVVETPQRDELFSVQTPQVFRSEILLAAHETVDQEVTDDASMVEIAGGLVGTFEGSYKNIKITTQSDIPIARAIAAGHRSSPTYCSGIGFDGHRLVDGGPLRLGGTEIDFEKHLQGHSDGDVLMHAVASGILGASGLGDLGGNFPSGDTKYTGFNSAHFIREATTRAASLGWNVDYVDTTVIAQRPRLASHAPAFQSNIANAIGIATEQVNVKITSTDEVGAIGRGEGIAAQAIVTLVR